MRKADQVPQMPRRHQPVGEGEAEQDDDQAGHEQAHDGEPGGDPDPPRVHLQFALSEADLVPDERRHVFRCQRDEFPKRLLPVGAV